MHKKLNQSSKQKREAFHLFSVAQHSFRIINKSERCVKSKSKCKQIFIILKSLNWKYGVSNSFM